MIKAILLLGNPSLYEVSEPVAPQEAAAMRAVVADLHDTLFEFRRQYQAGRAIAAPQIGIQKRLIYMHIDASTVMINPALEPLGSEQMEVWDDCMSFPNLLVRVRRWRRCRLTFRDLDWQEHELSLEDDLSELLQHEYDHLDGILATMRAIDNRSLRVKTV